MSSRSAGCRGVPLVCRPEKPTALGRTNDMSPAVRVQDCMRPGALAVAWEDSADAGFARMRRAGLDAIPVVKEGRVIGLLEHGAAHACQEGGSRPSSVPVASLMRRSAFVCRASDTVEQTRA